MVVVQDYQIIKFCWLCGNLPKFRDVGRKNSNSRKSILDDKEGKTILYLCHYFMLLRNNFHHYSNTIKRWFKSAYYFNIICIAWPYLRLRKSDIPVEKRANGIIFSHIHSSLCILIFGTAYPSPAAAPETSQPISNEKADYISSCLRTL